MKASDNFSRYDGDAVSYVDANGRGVRADDEVFEHEARAWEHDGVDIKLVYMARPLLEGTSAQRQIGAQFLTRVRDEGLDDAEAQMRLYPLLTKQGLGAGRAPHQTEAEFNRAWDDLSGSAAGRPSGDFSFGHSDKTRRESMSEGVNPDA